MWIPDCTDRHAATAKGHAWHYTHIFWPENTVKLGSQVLSTTLYRYPESVHWAAHVPCGYIAYGVCTGDIGSIGDVRIVKQI